MVKSRGGWGGGRGHVRVVVGVGGGALCMWGCQEERVYGCGWGCERIG